MLRTQTPIWGLPWGPTRAYPRVSQVPRTEEPGPSLLPPATREGRKTLLTHVQEHQRKERRPTRTAAFSFPLVSTACPGSPGQRQLDCPCAPSPVTEAVCRRDAPGTAVGHGTMPFRGSVSRAAGDTSSVSQGRRESPRAAIAMDRTVGANSTHRFLTIPEAAR